MNNNFNYYTGVIGYPILFVILIWLIFWVEFRFNVDLKSFGIQPRKLEGISGIIFSPFLHSSLEHLFNNSIPLFLLSSAIFFFYRTISWKIIFLGIFLSGLLTWIIGRDSTHIGASGLIYVLISFIFFKGIISKNFNLMALSLIVVFIYGGTIWYIFPIKNNMSWEGHLSGFMIGVLLALLFKKNTPVNKVYKWENEDYDNTNDPFLNQFDKDGNFIEKDEL
ncbi:MAG: rhomboid family intramembrane serine protease [Flavobacteriales bacterium]|tara:strand:- start:4684 stop:5349 length:666 start_codon:yes stop_codon:yes gene_type:complete